MEQEPKIESRHNQTPKDYLAEQEALANQRYKKSHTPEDAISNTQIRNQLHTIREKVDVFELAQNVYNEKWMKMDSTTPTEQEKVERETDKANLEQLRQQVFSK